MVRRPSVVVVVVHNFKHEYLCNQWADRNQILSKASLGLGKGCIRFWARSDQNSGFHGNRKLPYGYNGVSTFSQLFFIRSFLYWQAMMTRMRDRTSSNFSLIGPPTAELAALERLKKSPWAYNVKNDVSTFSRLFLIRSFSYLQVILTYMIAWMSLKFGQIQPLVSMVPDRVIMKKPCLHFFSAVFHPFLFILAGNDDMHESLDEFEFRPDWTTDCGVNCP